MKRSIYLLVALFFLASCAKDDLLTQQTETPPEIQQTELLSPQQINAIIKTSVNNTGNFNWMAADENVLYSAIVHGNNILTIGYGATSFDNAKSSKTLQLKSHLLEVVREFEMSNQTKENDVLIYEDPILNFVDVEITNRETLRQLMAEDGIRYLEPAGYTFFAYEKGDDKSDSGCDKSADNINAGDYTTIAPNALVPWTFYKHNIPAAWNYATGQGVYVGLIDTGVSPNQSLLGSNFSDGYSSSRYIYKYGTYVDSWWPWSTSTDGPNDKCGHGTSMAATIASPRNDNGLPVGVAYNCNLIAYRATGDVVLDGYHEQKGVANALTALADRSYLKVISMSIGHIFSIGRIEDAIKYAYGKGKLIIAAGGTSTSFTNWAGVIFPAWMSETVAVTGITDAGGFNACEVCHEGGEIDFTVIMERSYDTDRHSVCLGFYEGDKSYVGGSSVATATTAGIAALIWERHPSWTRSQVLQKMKESASLYPNKNANFGYGNIDALQAVQ